MQLKNRSTMLLLLIWLSLITQQSLALTQSLQPNPEDTIINQGVPAPFTGVLVSPTSYKDFTYYREAYSALKEQYIDDPTPDTEVVRFQLGDWKLIAVAGVLGLGLGYLAFHR